MNVVTYTPHGPIPDNRGFAPSLAAQYLARYLQLFRNTHVCQQETHPQNYENHPELGEIWRLHESQAYRLLFRKLSRLDPVPLHARLAKLLQGRRVDLLHAHQLEFPVEDFRRRLGRHLPVVIHAHALRTLDPAWGLADAYIAVSGYTRDALVEKGFPAERVHVVHNGADTDLFSPASPSELERLRSLLGFQGKRVMAYVGRKQESKGYFAFLEALELLSETHPEIQGIAAGALPPGAEHHPDYADCLARVARLSARGVLLDLPALPHSSLPRVFQVADVLLFPTQFSGEQHPLVLIEALASGCVVITAPIAGIRETVDERAAILLDDVGSPAALAAAALKVLENPGAYAEMRRRAREIAVSRYDWRQQSTLLERIYFSCLGR